VRWVAGKVRSRLSGYYSENSNTAVRIRIPARGYRPCFEPAARPARPGLRALGRAALTIAAAAVLGAFFLVGMVRNERRGMADAYNRGVWFMHSHRYPEAAASFEAVLRKDPHNAGARYNLAVCRMNAHRWTEAAVEFSNVLGADPQNADALYNRAVCYLNTRQFRSANEDLTLYLLRRQTDRAYRNRAKARRNLGDLEGARQDLHEAEILGY
jgi:tetratricopeptide (TPR) repeat protein